MLLGLVVGSLVADQHSPPLIHHPPVPIDNYIILPSSNLSTSSLSNWKEMKCCSLDVKIHESTLNRCAQYRIKSIFVLIDPRITLNRCVQYRIKSPFVLIDPRITLNHCVQYRIKSPFVLIDPRITLKPCVQYRIKSPFVLIDLRINT